MKKFFTVLGIVIILLGIIIFFKNLIIKSVVIKVASEMTGAPVHIDGFSINIFTSTIHIRGFRMNNPSNFPEGLLVSCPKIDVIFDRGSLFNHKLYFKLIDVDIKEMVLTKNSLGKLNVDALKIVHPTPSSSPVAMKIDLLNLSIGQIIYKDYSAGVAPSVRVYEINRHQSYKSIPTARQLALLVLTEPMKAAAIKNAEIYGVAVVAGVAMLPVAVVATLISKDSAEQIIDANIDQVYKASLQVCQSAGKIIQEGKSSGVIKANIKGSKIALVLKVISNNTTQITISARKFMLPQPEVAGGVLYQIQDKLKGDK